MNLSNFVERLKELMEDADLNAPALAREIGANRTTVSEILRGKYPPSTKYLVAIVEYFGCSADYLLGNIEFPPAVSFKPRRKFGDVLSEHLKERNMTEYGLQKKLGVSSSLIYGWLRNRIEPNVNSLCEVAKKLGCSVDYLLGRE